MYNEAYQCYQDDLRLRYLDIFIVEGNTEAMKQRLNS